MKIIIISIFPKIFCHNDRNIATRFSIHEQLCIIPEWKNCRKAKERKLWLQNANIAEAHHTVEIVH